MAEEEKNKKIFEEVAEGTTDSGTQELGENDIAIAEKVQEEEEKKYTDNLTKLNEELLKQTDGILRNQTKKINSLTIEGLMEDMAQVKYGDTVIAIVQNGKIEYNSNAEKPEIKEKLEEINEKLLNEQKENEQDFGEREEEKETDNLKDVEDENKKENSEEEKHEEDDEKQEEKPLLKKDSSWIELKPSREINEMQTLEGIIKKNCKGLGEINRMYIVPQKNDANRFKLVVEGKQNQFTEVELAETEGKNPAHEQITTLDNDGNNVKKQSPIQILKINDRNMIMIFKGGRTNTSIHFGTRTDSDDKKSSEIGGSRSFNLKDPNENVKEQIGDTRANQGRGDDASRAYEVVSNFEKQNVPDDINPAKDPDGIEVEEIKDFPKGIVDTLENNLKTMMDKRGIHVTNEAINVMSKSIIAGKDFKNAIIEGMKVDEGKTIPPGSAEKNGEGIYRALVDGEEYEQEDPREPSHRRTGE